MAGVNKIGREFSTKHGVGDRKLKVTGGGGDDFCSEYTTPMYKL